ncbi:hypothetical protein [Photobacterium lipolyticum]|uniref:Integrase n=1 Tax=Photobacterium lipolyticum TaxID=266810 RepID=A0A2T3MQT1_9GAMM|nr:hypothetical protein [Photobacterium lipolyticum]PSV99564.1 hypothetical protein C9I89_21680 [Photobacterium lipolyticum]
MSEAPIGVRSTAQLAPLKQRFGKDAKFVSKDGFPFNAFDEYWQLNAVGINGQGIDTKWILESGYDEALHIDIRFALADMAQKLAFITVYGTNSVLRKLQLVDYSLPTVRSFWVAGKPADKMRLKSFVYQLNILNPRRYSEVFHWTLHSKIKKGKLNIYDPEKGALSDIENQSFDIALNHHIREFIERGFGPADVLTNRLHTAGNLTSFGHLIAVRLLQVLVRRPANLVQLKWCDIIPVGASFNDINISNEYAFSDEHELQVRMWKAKQKNTFRQAVEREPLLLCSSVSKEVLTYRQEYQRCLNVRLEAIGLQLTDNEVCELMARSPLFFSAPLFTTLLSNKAELFKALGRNSQAFHTSSTSLGSSIRNATQKLEIVSDRVASGMVKINNTRIRHTVGTNGAREGLPLTQIAKLLGNNPESAKAYLDMSNEQRASIDDKFAGNAFLVQAFSKSVTQLLTAPEFVIEDEFGHEAGQVKSQRTCHNCAETRPIGCYGCDNFQALVTGDHRALLEQAQTKLQIRVDIGEPPNSLQRLKTQIQYIQATIVICDEIITRGSALNAQ